MDPNENAHLRPLSSIPFLSKIVEKGIQIQINDYTSTNNLTSTLNDLGYKSLFKIRQRPGGGVAFLFPCYYNIKKVYTKLQVFNTMDILVVEWIIGAKIIKFINVYRYPYSKKTHIRCKRFSRRI